MLSFMVSGGLASARAFLNSLSLITVATSLGGVETVIEIPYDLDFGVEELGDVASKTGISPALIRLSVGIEDFEDLKSDLNRGFEAIQCL